MEPADQIIAASEARHASLTIEQQAIVDAYEAAVWGCLEAEQHLDMQVEPADVDAAYAAWEDAQDIEADTYARLRDDLPDIDIDALNERVREEFRAARAARAASDYLKAAADFRRSAIRRVMAAGGVL